MPGGEAAAKVSISGLSMRDLQDRVFTYKEWPFFLNDAVGQCSNLVVVATHDFRAFMSIYSCRPSPALLLA